MDEDKYQDIILSIIACMGIGVILAYAFDIASVYFFFLLIALVVILLAIVVIFGILFVVSSIVDAVRLRKAIKKFKANSSSYNTKNLYNYIDEIKFIKMEDVKLNENLISLTEELSFINKNIPVTKKYRFENICYKYLDEVISKSEIYNNLPKDININNIEILKSDLLDLIDLVKNIIKKEKDNYFENIVDNASADLKAVKNKININGLAYNKSPFKNI